jgi:hypothetical protein
LVKRCPRYGLPKFEGSLPYEKWALSNVTHINAHTITKTCPTSMLSPKDFKPNIEICLFKNKNHLYSKDKIIRWK